MKLPTTFADPESLSYLYTLLQSSFDQMNDPTNNNNNNTSTTGRKRRRKNEDDDDDGGGDGDDGSSNNNNNQISRNSLTVSTRHSHLGNCAEFVETTRLGT